MNEKKISRRKFLKNISAGAATYFSVVAVFPALFSGCRNNPNQNAQRDNFIASKSTKIRSDQQGGAISSRSKKARLALKYVDQTPIATRRCDNCKLYKQPRAGSADGGCKLFSGPVKPGGYCNSWYPRM